MTHQELFIKQLHAMAKSLNYDLHVVKMAKSNGLRFNLELYEAIITNGDTKVKWHQIWEIHNN